MQLLAYTPGQITAFWSAVTGVAAALAGGTAIATLLALRKDSRDRTRPVVVAELILTPLGRGTIRLRVRNVGPSVAKNLRVTFEPVIKEEVGPIIAYLVRRFKDEIPTLGPGSAMTNIYANFDGSGSGKTVEPVPESVTVTTAYTDARKHSYKDVYRLTIRTLMNNAATSPSDVDNPDDRQRRLVKAVEVLAQVIGSKDS